MELTCNRADLVGALKYTAKTLTKGFGSLPILSHYKIETIGSKLRITANDLEKICQVDIPAMVFAPGAFAVPALPINTIARKATSENAAITSSDDGERLHFACGEAKAFLPVLPVDDFPTMEKLPATDTFQLEGKALTHLFSRVMHAVSNEETRFYLNGPFLHTVGSQGELAVTATDGHRLAHHIYSETTGLGVQVIVPTDTARLFMDAASEVEVVTIEVANSFIAMRAGGVYINSKVIDGSYPDYKSVFPKTRKGHLKMKKADLLVVVETAKSLCDPKKAPIIAIASNSEESVIYANSPFGDFLQAIDCAHDGPETVLNFNAGYMCDALNALPGQTVRIDFYTPGEPFQIATSENVNHRQIIMPVNEPVKRPDPARELMREIEPAE